MAASQDRIAEALLRYKSNRGGQQPESLLLFCALSKIQRSDPVDIPGQRIQPQHLHGEADSVCVPGSGGSVQQGSALSIRLHGIEVMAFKKKAQHGTLPRFRGRTDQKRFFPGSNRVKIAVFRHLPDGGTVSRTDRCQGLCKVHLYGTPF